MIMKFSFKHVVTKVTNIASISIGGLEITDSVIRFLRIDRDGVKHTFLALSPGVVHEGRVKDAAQLISSLAQIHSQLISSPKKIIHVVLSIPASNVYVQAFNLPQLHEKELRDAAVLNLQMIPPLDIASAYSDWQRVGEDVQEGGQYEILGAFIAREVVDEFVRVLGAARFGVAAVEFLGLGIVRTLREVAGSLDMSQPHLLAAVTNEGVYRAITRQRSLHCHYFHPWAGLMGVNETTSLDALQQLFIAEVQRVLNFYTSHWGNQVQTCVLFTDGLQDQLSALMREHFPGIIVQQPILQKFSDIPLQWFGVLGAAFRGLVPRSGDTDISLMSVGAAEEFHHNQLLIFVRRGRTIMLLVFSFMILITSLASFFLRQTLHTLENETAAQIKTPESAEFVAFQEQARDFNELVALLGKAREGRKNLSELFDSFTTISGGVVTFRRISFQAPGDSITIHGDAVNEATALAFKDKLIQSGKFSEISLPLESFVVEPTGRVSFTVIFKAK